MASCSVEIPRLGRSLSSEKRRKYKQLVTSIVQNAVDEYAEHIAKRVNKRVVDPSQWKLMKTRDNIKIYKSRDALRPNLFDEPVGVARQRNNSDRWLQVASVLCAGSLVGSVDDALYGAATPTDQSMAVRSLLTQDEFMEHRVLQTIQSPAMEDPLSYVALKWGLRTSRVIIRPRDFLFVEAAGFHDMPHRGGVERIGYFVHHSVDPVEVEPARIDGVTRARISMCLIFRQKACGIVDVYGTFTTDPGANLHPSLAAQSAASTLLALAGVIDCAHNKKLSWAVRSSLPAKPARRSPHGCCKNCTRSLSSFNSISSCGICREAVCSRCATSKKLIVSANEMRIRQKNVSVCNKCVAKTTRLLPAAQVAADEFVVNTRDRFATPLSVNWTPTPMEGPSQASAATTASRSASPDYDQNVATMEPSLRRVVSAPTSSARSVARERTATESVVTPSSIPILPSPTEPVSSRQQDAMELLRQMTALRVRTERTLQIIQHTKSISGTPLAGRGVELDSFATSSRRNALLRSLSVA